MFTGVDAATALVLTVKVALVAPAGTVTLEGTLAAELLLERATCAPPAGAAPLSVTVPVEELPPVTLVGFSATDDKDREGGFTVRVAVCVPPLKVPEIVTAVELLTALVVTAKVALVAPAATVTLAGTVAATVLLLESVTAAPPAGAAPLRVTVPVEELPPVTLVGLSATDDKDREGGFTVRVAVWVPPLKQREITTP